eukprot:scaffold342878_cov28-Attheya_sp.AAC.1
MTCGNKGPNSVVGAQCHQCKAPRETHLVLFLDPSLSSRLWLFGYSTTLASDSDTLTPEFA